MAWTTPRTWTTGELVTAALLNTHIRDNLNETMPAKITTAGDLVYGTSANAIARRAIGTNGYALRADTADSAPKYRGALAARVYHTLNDNGLTTGNGWTSLSFNSERFDEGAFHSSTASVSGRLVAPVAGRYLVCGHAAIASSPPNGQGASDVVSLGARIVLNASNVLAAHEEFGATGGGATSRITSVTTIYSLSAGEYVEFQVRQVLGAGIVVSPNGDFSPDFMIALLD